MKIYFQLVCLIFFCTAEALSAEPLCKKVDGSWTWFGDHANLKTVYVVAVQSDFEVRAATGVSVFSNPLGNRFDFSDTKEIKAYGVGALHIKKRSGQDNPLVCVDQGGLTALELKNHLYNYLNN